MTQPAFSLVTNTPAPPSPAVEPSGPTPAEKAIIAEYVQDFKRRGFCKIDDDAHTQTRLLNRINGRLFPQTYIENDFMRWLHANEKECSFISARYMMRTLVHVAGLVFNPVDLSYITEQETGCTFVNTYKKYKPTTECKEVSELFGEYFKRLAPVPEERHIFLCWLSHIFQHPEQRPSWHIMMTSDTGTGKGYLVEKILHPLLKHTQVLSTYARLTGQFSTVLEENLLVLLDDCKARSESQQTQLKSFLTEERAYVERKRLQGGMVQTYTRFILASNEHKPLNIEDNERRWYALTRLEHKVDRSETAAFIKKLDGWLSLPGSLDAVYNFFMSYQLKGFDHKDVPESVTLLEMVKLSKGIHAEVLEAFVVDHPVFTTAELMAEYDDQKLSRPPTKSIPAMLHDIGYRNSQKTVNDCKMHICHPIGMQLEAIRAAYPPPEITGR